MCGILGVIGSKKADELSPALLRHRGPDGEGFWSAQPDEFPVVLAHTRLAILDLSSSGSQPMHSEDGRYVFVFNGEVYNFLELRKDLESCGHIFKTNTDTEVFLTGLIAEGPSFQLRCNGMWAFCLWDRFAKKALFGRDRFGKKPLFFLKMLDGGLAFASEMKALYPLMNSVEPSDQISDNFEYLFDYEHTHECVVKGINRLPLGHWGEFQGGHLKTHRWWNTLDHLQEVPKSYDEQVEKWRELFLDSVRLRMRSDVKIGAALSGGLDSSAVFCAVSHIASQGSVGGRQASDWQNGFCAHYPGSSIDEVEWARVVTNSINVPLHAVEINPLDCGWSIDRALYQVEDPYLTLPLPMLATYKAISNAGIKVTLDGHGADELFSGYGHLKKAIKNTTPMQYADLIAIEQSTRSGKYLPNYKNLLARWVIARIMCRASEFSTIPRRIAKSALGRMDWRLIAHQLSYPDQNHPNFKALDPLSKDLYEIFHVSVLPTLLRNYDRYSMASGIETRMPFMDWRLVTYTFSLPWTSKVGGGYTKRIMRDAMKGILPEPVRTRRDKIGWNAPMHEWLKGPLHDEIKCLLVGRDVSSKTMSHWLKLQNNPSPDFMDGQKMWGRILPILWKRSLDNVKNMH